MHRMLLPVAAATARISPSFTAPAVVSAVSVSVCLRASSTLLLLLLRLLWLLLLWLLLLLLLLLTPMPLFIVDFSIVATYVAFVVAVDE